MLTSSANCLMGGAESAGLVTGAKGKSNTLALGTASYQLQLEALPSSHITRQHLNLILTNCFCCPGARLAAPASTHVRFAHAWAYGVPTRLSTVVAVCRL